MPIIKNINPSKNAGTATNDGLKEPYEKDKNDIKKHKTEKFIFFITIL